MLKKNLIKINPRKGSLVCKMNEKNRIIDSLKKRNSFPETIQKKIGRDRSVTYAVYFLNKNNIEPTFQRICVVLYKLFPESFSFTEFPEYLDSRNIRNCLWHCTHNNWLIGSDKTKYKLSEEGEKIALEIEKLDKNKMDIKSLPLKLRKKKDFVTKPIDDSYLVKEIKDSKGYKKFSEKQELQKLDIALSLGGDRYSSKNFLEKQLKIALEKAKVMNEKDIIPYLLQIKKDWGKYFK